MKIVQKLQKGDEIKYGTKEYKDAYNRGTITRKVGDVYVAKDLDEVTVKPKNYNPVGQAVSKKLNNVGNILTKTAMSLTPYSPIMAGMELGASFVPGSSNYGDTKNAAINAGLEVLPYGIMTGLGRLGKFLNRGPKTIRSKQAIASAVEGASPNLMSKQNLSFLNGISGFDKVAYGGEVRATLNNSGEAMISINPDIQRRMSAAGMKQKPYRYITPEGTIVKPKADLVDNITDSFHFGEPVSTYSTDLIRNTGSAGKTDPRGNITLYRGQGNKYFSPSDIKDTAEHESLHRFQSYTGTTLDKPSKNYYVADKSNPISKALKPYLNSDKWAASADEVWADTWAYRLRNNIGARDLTDNEAMEAVVNLARHWDMSKFSPQAMDKLKLAIQALPASAGIYLGTKLIPKDESQIH